MGRKSERERERGRCGKRTCIKKMKYDMKDKRKKVKKEGNDYLIWDENMMC